MRQNVRRLAEESKGVQTNAPPEDLTRRFQAAISDDFDMSGALSVAWESLRRANRSSRAEEKRSLLAGLLDFDRVLGLGLSDVASAGAEVLPTEIAALIQQRETARAARDWAAADALRERIWKQGYQIEDTPSGSKWRRI